MPHAHYMGSDAGQLPLAGVDYSPLLGTWINLNAKTEHLLQVGLTQEGESYKASALGAGPDGPVDLGVAEAALFAVSGTTQPQGFAAGFQTATGQTHVTVNLNQGILVIQTYTTFQDNSGRANYFTKEYFRAEAAVRRDV